MTCKYNVDGFCKYYFTLCFKTCKRNMAKTKNEISADVALSAIAELEREGYADNVFAQLAGMFDPATLLHWAQLLTTRNTEVKKD